MNTYLGVPLPWNRDHVTMLYFQNLLSNSTVSLSYKVHNSYSEFCSVTIPAASNLLPAPFGKTLGWQTNGSRTTVCFTLMFNTLRNLLRLIFSALREGRAIAQALVSGFFRRSEACKKQVPLCIPLGSCWLLVWFIPRLWRWRQLRSSKTSVNLFPITQPHLMQNDSSLRWDPEF